MFLHHLFFIIFLIIFAAPVLADDRTKEVDQVLAQAQEMKAVAETWEGRNSDQPYIAFINEYETTINPDWSFVESYHVRVKIQQESAKELGEWPIYYNKAREQIVDVQAFVETPEGKKLPATKMKDMDAYENSPMYSDMKVKVVTLPQVSLGSIIDVTVKSKTSAREIPSQFWDVVPYPAIPTKYARHTYIFPEDKPLEFKAQKMDYNPIIEKKDGRLKYSFVFNETDYSPEEDLMPPPEEVIGSLYISSVKDWQQVADWFRGLSVNSIVETPGIVAKTTELTKDKATAREKVRAIIEYIQDDFRYVTMNFGDHGVEPHATNETFKNRYGDSKDLCLLVKQMFKLAGIDSNIALLSGEFSGNPQAGLPSPSLFEHVILEAVVDGQKYFIDPQTRGFDLGEFPSTYDNSHVLVIEDSGYHFDNLPIAPDTNRSVMSQSDVVIRPDGSALFTVHVKLPLEASQGFRQAWLSTSDDMKDKFFESLEANFSQGGNMISHEVKGAEDRYGPIEFNLKYESPAAYPVVNDMILLKEADQSDVPDFAAVDRQYPVFLPTNSLIVNSNVYHVPEGYKIDFLPKDYNLRIDFAEVTGAYKVDQEGAISVDTEYRMQRAKVPAERYKEITDFREALFKKNDQYVVLKKKEQTSEQAKDWIKNQ